MSVTPYRDAGFLPQGFINFLCLLGWSPKNDREVMSRQDLTDLFSLEGINQSNATVNFTDQDPFDPKAMWLNAEHLRALPVDELAKQLMPFAEGAGWKVDLASMVKVTPLIREAIRIALKEVTIVADFFFVEHQLAPYEKTELILQKGTRHGAPGPAKSVNWTMRSSAMILSTRRCGAAPKVSRSKPGKCFSRFASPCAAERTPHLCLKLWKCWGAKNVLRASGRP